MPPTTQDLSSLPSGINSIASISLIPAYIAFNTVYSPSVILWIDCGTECLVAYAAAIIDFSFLLLILIHFFRILRVCFPFGVISPGLC